MFCKEQKRGEHGRKPPRSLVRSHLQNSNLCDWLSGLQIPRQLIGDTGNMRRRVFVSFTAVFSRRISCAKHVYERGGRVSADKAACGPAGWRLPLGCQRGKQRAVGGDLGSACCPNTWRYRAAGTRASPLTHAHAGSPRRQKKCAALFCSLIDSSEKKS